jgi:hypothetical protein
MARGVKEDEGEQGIDRDQRASACYICPYLVLSLPFRASVSELGQRSRLTLTDL